MISTRNPKVSSALGVGIVYSHVQLTRNPKVYYAVNRNTTTVSLDC